jgi:proteasome lid subunit RPN8/RPN11
VWEALDAIPDGAIILGIFHSQPDNGRMSDIDWNAYKSIFSDPGSPSMIARPGSFAITESIGRGITADPNGLSYVYDMKSGKIHVYDKSDMGSDKVQCHVNNSNGGG